MKVTANVLLTFAETVMNDLTLRINICYKVNIKFIENVIHIGFCKNTDE